MWRPNPRRSCPRRADFPSQLAPWSPSVSRSVSSMSCRVAPTSLRGTRRGYAPLSAWFEQPGINGHGGQQARAHPARQGRPKLCCPYRAQTPLKVHVVPLIMASSLPGTGASLSQFKRPVITKHRETPRQISGLECPDPRPLGDLFLPAADGCRASPAAIPAGLPSLKVGVGGMVPLAPQRQMRQLPTPDDRGPERGLKAGRQNIRRLLGWGPLPSSPRAPRHESMSSSLR